MKFIPKLVDKRSDEGCFNPMTQLLPFLLDQRGAQTGIKFILNKLFDIRNGEFSWYFFPLLIHPLETIRTGKLILKQEIFRTETRNGDIEILLKQTLLCKLSLHQHGHNHPIAQLLGLHCLRHSLINHFYLLFWNYYLLIYH